MRQHIDTPSEYHPCNSCSGAGDVAVLRILVQCRHPVLLQGATTALRSYQWNPLWVSWYMSCSQVHLLTSSSNTKFRIPHPASRRMAPLCVGALGGVGPLHLQELPPQTRRHSSLRRHAPQLDRCPAPNASTQCLGRRFQGTGRREQATRAASMRRCEWIRSFSWSTPLDGGGRTDSRMAIVIGRDEGGFQPPRRVRSVRSDPVCLWLSSRGP